MRRPLTHLGAALAVAFIAIACGEIRSPVSTQDPVAVDRRAPRAIVPGTCTDINSLLQQAATVFGAGSPDYNSVRGKLENLQHQINNGNFAEAKSRAFDIVDFTLGKASGLPGTEEQLAAFLSNVYCFAGLDITVTDPSNSHLIYPDDQEQVVYNEERTAAVKFPAFPVNAPTLVTFQTLPNTYPLGGGPLDTKLDQYPGFHNITAQADAEVILAQPATVGVCVQGVIADDVREDLRLGHQASYGFEITPAAEADFLDCLIETPSTTAALQPKPWERITELLLPAKLHAKRQDVRRGGGLGGTVTEFSPFAPVDTEVRKGGGLGGTVTEFLRSPITTSALMSTTAAAVEDCDPIEAPIGSPVAVNCLPTVRIHTRLGTNLSGVPVTWTVTEGGGTIAPRSNATCGTYGSSFTQATTASGRSGICWTLGAEGLNRVTATAAPGGDAPPGVTFVPETNTFDATANPPSKLSFTQVPTSLVAGVPFEVRVQALDKNDDRVMAYTGGITVTLNQFTFAGGSASATVNAVAGEAVFPALVINKAASGYTLTASSDFLQPPATLPTSATFSVSPASAAALTIVQGNGQTAPAGTIVPIAPTVRVTDAFGNAVGGEGVRWTPGLSSTGSVSPDQTVSGTSGETSTQWTLGAGDNQLRAELVALPSVAVVFEAFGTSTLTVLNACALGNSGDPINDPSKPYAFYLANPGPNKTMREIQLSFSATGRANEPTPYIIEITTQRSTFDPGVSIPVATRTTVMLRGNNSEKKTATFTLTQPIVGEARGGPIMVRMNVITNPDGSTINFNTGPCSPGQNCKVPKGCEATEVSNPLPYPLGTFYRKSVGVTVKGN